jgi:DNA-binding LytR/AlgR family response regulator
MITCAIIDDDNMSRLALETLTKRVPSMELKGSFSSALEARYFLQVEVTDFLLKPVSLERFLKTVNRIESKLAVTAKPINDSMFIKANNQLINLSLSAINYVEAYGDYVNIYTEKDRYIVHGTMKGMEAKLPVDEFVRVHRSHIVRIDKINAIEETVIIIGKKLIPIGDSYRNLLMNQLSFF